MSDARLLVRLGIAILITAMLTGPFVSAPAYSWLSHTLSELAGQGMPNAWIMRAGFAGYGGGIVASVFLHRRQWSPTGLALLVFGAAMVAIAVFSARPIDPAMPYDRGEDDVHSILASLVGFAFAAACATRLFFLGGSSRDGLSWVGLVASVAIPAFMFGFPEWDGAPQRVMFLISAAWMWRELGMRQKSG